MPAGAGRGAGAVLGIVGPKVFTAEFAPEFSAEAVPLGLAVSAD